MLPTTSPIPANWRRRGTRQRCWSPVGPHAVIAFRRYLLDEEGCSGRPEGPIRERLSLAVWPWLLFVSFSSSFISPLSRLAIHLSLIREFVIWNCVQTYTQRGSMSQAAVLVVCLGNICRSPMGEAVLCVTTTRQLIIKYLEIHEVRMLQRKEE